MEENRAFPADWMGLGQRLGAAASWRCGGNGRTHRVGIGVSDGQQASYDRH
jgi:hypothetical protein